MVLDIYQRGAAVIGAAVAESGDDPLAQLRAYLEANLEFTAEHPVEADTATGTVFCDVSPGGFYGFRWRR